MSAQDIRAALGRLQQEPDREDAWTELTDAATSPGGLALEERKALLEAARRGHELRREWDAVARVLELEVALAAGTPVGFAMQWELARVLDEELGDLPRARAAYEALLAARADDADARSALARLDAAASTWQERVRELDAEAAGARDATTKSARLGAAADLAYRHAGTDPAARAQVVTRLESALGADARNVRAAMLLERVYRADGAWEDVARIAELLADDAPRKEDRVAALLRLGRTATHRLAAQARAVSAYERVLDLWPGQRDAMGFLSEYFADQQEWDYLIALYEDQLRGGGVRAGEEAGVVFQIAMVHSRMRGDAAAAEPWFERLRRSDPSHPGMLDFFRERCGQTGDAQRLMTVLIDAQRSLPEGAQKAALASEIAKLAEAGDQAQKAIDQYKTILRHEPSNAEARTALKRLYTQTEGWNALIELLRQDLEHASADDPPARLAVLREIARVYRDQIKSDTALVTVLTQIVALDESDVDSLRELVRVYETLGRWRDLLTSQAKLAHLLPEGSEKSELFRSVARRWLEQFTNVQNATDAYEALLATAPGDAEAEAKLRELYAKRRAWPQLFALYEREVEQKTGEERIALLLDMARLAADRLDRGTDAIALFKRVLDEDPARGDALDALEKQAERTKDFATAADVLERRIASATDEAARLASLQKLGALYTDRLGDHASAARTWRRILDLSPGHPKALRVLRDSYLAAGDYDGLEELYASQRDWEGLAEVLSGAADKAADADLKIALSFRAARVLADQLRAPERAVRSYERVLTVRPDDAVAATALVALYEQEERWVRLPALYEVLLGHATTDDDRLALLAKLVDVTGTRLSDRAAALAWARRAYDVAPTDATLDALELASRAARSWDGFLEVVETRIKKKKTPAATKRALRGKLARLYARELGRVDEAIATYKVLVEEDASDAESVEALDRILRSTGRQDDLRWLFQLRADRDSGAARAAILGDLASIEEDVYGDVARAIEAWRLALAADPSNLGAQRALPRLLLGAGDAAAAASVLEATRELVGGAARVARELDLGELYLDRLERPDGALACALAALEIEPLEPRGVALLERLLSVPSTRVRAAEVLDGIWGDSGNFRLQVRAVEALLEAAAGPSRLALFTRLASIHDEHLSAPGLALDVLLRALAECPTELSLWDTASELATRAGRPTDLAAALESALRAELPDDVEVDLCERAATLHDERLGDPDGAVPWLERVLQRRPGDPRAFARLSQILSAQARWEQLQSAYDGAIAGATDVPRKVELLLEVARLCEDVTVQPDRAIGHHEKVLELEPLHERATQALDALYVQQRRWPALAALLDRRLEAADDDARLALELRLGALYLDELHDPPHALTHLADALELDPASGDARRLVERILDIGSLRPRAAEVLEHAYDARSDYRDLLRVLEVRLETADDDIVQRELLGRIALLADEKLSDDAAAFAALARLLPLDPADGSARERFAEIGRRLAAHDKVAAVLEVAAGASSDRHLRSEILLEVARLHEDLRGDVPRATATYRAALAIAPDDPTLAMAPARELERLYVAAGDHAELASILETQVSLQDDDAERRLLLARIGELHEGVLGQPDRAIDAWQRRLADDATDDDALAALERLFERTRNHRGLVEVCRMRAEGALDAGARHALLAKVAETLGGPLDAPVEAIQAWRAVVDDAGSDAVALAALAALYEKTARWLDLAETLEAELATAETDAARVELLCTLARVRREHLDDAAGALDAAGQGLSLAPSHEGCRAQAERLLDTPDARREAAELLRPLYEADADHTRLLRVLEVEADAAEDPARRLELLAEALRTAEGPLGDPGRAFAHALRGIGEAAAEPDVMVWVDRGEQLASATGRWAELVERLHSVASEVPDGEALVELHVRIGDLARTKLDDRKHAIEHYRAALDVRADELRALVALDELYVAGAEHEALRGILDRRLDVTESDDERRALAHRKARLLRDTLGDAPGAIGVYEGLLDDGLDPEAVSALDALYRATGRSTDLVALYERRIAAAPEAADLRAAVARILREDEHDIARAFDEIEAALAIDPQHPGAVGELETILATHEDATHRAHAAELLEPVYLRRADWRSVVTTLQARLATTDDPIERRPLLQRLAKLHEEQGEDYAAALDTTGLLLHDDPADDATRAELERLARLAGAERRLADLYARELAGITTDEPSTAAMACRAAELFASFGDAERALALYRRALAFDPESRPVFDAVDALLTAAGRSAERVTHYRASLDHRFDPADRVAALRVIAALQRRALDAPDPAIDTYAELLDIEPGDEPALEATSELLRERGRLRELAELYERRAEAATDAERSAELRLALARVDRDDLSDVSAAIDQYEQIVASLPFHAEAIADLEALVPSPEHGARVIDILRPLYERRDDWRHLISINGRRFQLAETRDEQVAVLRETATLWETRGNDLARAQQALCQAIDLDPDDGASRAELERVIEATGDWDALVGTFEAVLDRADTLVKREILLTLARVHDTRRDDPRQALAAWQRLSELDATDPEPLEAQDQLATLLSDWAALVRVLTRKIDLASNDAEQATLLRRVGEALRDMLDDPRGALAAYDRALELEPDSAFTLDCVLELVAPSEAERVVELERRRVELCGPGDDDRKFELLVAIAEACATRLERPREAIDALRDALGVRPGDRGLLARLDGLLRAEELWPDLLDNLRLEASAAESVEERTALRKQIAELLATHLDDAAEAISTWHSVLEDAPGDADTTAALLALGDAREEHRLAVTEVLEPVLRRASRHTELARVLDMRLRAQSDPVERARTLVALAEVQEGALARPSDALDALLAAIAETPEDATLHASASRVAAACSGFDRYAAALEERAASTFDAELASDLAARLAVIAEEKLGDDRRAIAAWVRAVEQAGDTPDALASLDRLYARVGDHAALADVLERRVALEADASVRADLLTRLASQFAGPISDRGRALATVRQVLDLDVAHAGARETLEALLSDDALFVDVAESLELVYRGAGDDAKLVELAERRVARASTPTERTALRLDLARLFEDRLGDQARAQRVLEATLADDPTDFAVLDEIERLAAIRDGWGEATEAWTAALTATTSLPPDVARDAWLRLAGWARDHMGARDRAAQAFERALSFDAENTEILRMLEDLCRGPGQERDLVAALRRRAGLESDEATKRELRREAKVIAEDTLGDAALAEQIVRDLLRDDDADAWALEELARLRAAAGDDAEVLALIERQAELAGDPSEVARLHHEAARIARDRLGDKAKAIALYEALLDADPTDAEAAAALRALYAASDLPRELGRLLERLIDVGDTPALRSRLRLELAALQRDRFGAPADAIETLRAVLDDEPADAEAIAALSALYEQGSRYEDLAELIANQFASAEAPAAAALGMQLGELYETRLSDTRRALETYESVLGREPSHREALVRVARLAAAQGDARQAMGVLQTLLAMSEGDDARAFALQLADVAASAGDDEGVRSALEQGVAGAPGDADLRSRLVALYERLEDWTALARLITEEADAATDPPARVALYRKAAALHVERRGDPEAAAAALERAREQAPDDRDLLLELSDAHGATGRWRAAVEVLETVVASFGGKRSKELAVVHQRLARALLADGDRERALTELDQAFKIDPGSVAVLKDLGALALETGDLDRAQKTFRALLLQKLDASSPISKGEVFFHLGDISSRQGDKVKGIQMLERALENDPGLEAARTLLDQLKRS